ncbi:quinol monooxygenase YgiN [Salibacterium salarium]|nr:quinol monooxygenase YgiN [Salibacterium salarium]
MKVKTDVHHTFLERTKELVKQSQLEEGNISYKLYQDTDHPNTFVMIEEWKDQHAVDHHFESSHFKEFGKITEELLQEPPHVVKYSATSQ